MPPRLIANPLPAPRDNNRIHILRGMKRLAQPIHRTQTLMDRMAHVEAAAVPWAAEDINRDGGQSVEDVFYFAGVDFSLLLGEGEELVWGGPFIC